MTIGSINGYPVYKITKNEVDYTPSDFMKAYDTWEEGTKKGKLSEEEMSSLKQKYGSDKMSDKESIQFFGDLVKAGLLSKVDAQSIYNGLMPLDVSNYDGTSQGVLTPCSGTDPVRPSKHGLFHMPGETARDYSDFASRYDQIKKSNQGEDDTPYLRAYDGFLQVMEQLRRAQIKQLD